MTLRCRRNLYEQSKIFDVVVWGAPQIRSNLTEPGNMLIDTPGGGTVVILPAFA